MPRGALDRNVGPIQGSSRRRREGAGGVSLANLRELFDEVCDLEPGQREKRLQAVARTDPDLARKVRRLIDGEDSIPDGFL